MNYEEFYSKSVWLTGVKEQGCIEHFRLLYKFLECKEKDIEKLKLKEKDIEKLKLEVESLKSDIKLSNDLTYNR